VESALAHARQSLEIALRIGSTFSRVAAYSAVGHAHLLRGEWDESVDAIEQCLEVTRDRRTGVEQESRALVTLAEAHLGRGDLGRARAAADEAVERARRGGTVINEPAAQIALTRVLLRAEGAGARSAIEAALDRASTLLRETGAKIHEPGVHIERAELARLLGDEATRQRELREAHRLFTAMGATARAEEVARQLTSVSATG